MTRSVTAIRRLFQPGEGVQQRAIRSGAWLFALRATGQVFDFVRIIILARVLAPNDFGVFGICMLAMMVINTFTVTGFRAALIQRKGIINEYLDAAWTIEIIRGALLFAAVFFAAPYVAAFFDTPAALRVVQVVGISALLQSLVNIGTVFFDKELEFNKQFLYEISGTLADFIVAVTAALILRSVWALVFGLLASATVRVIISYVIHPYRPRLSLDLGKARELFVFGKWMLGSAALGFLFSQGDDIIVGRILGATLLGFYQMAYRISNLPTTEITHVISRVTFPAFSKLQDNVANLRLAYLKVLRVNAFLSVPMAAGIFVVAPEFVHVFLTDKWLPMVQALQMLALFGLLMSIGAAAISVFQATGKPGIAVRWQVLRLVILGGAIVPLSLRWGISGTAIAVVVSQLVATFGFSFIVVRITECRWIDFIRPLAFPLTSALLMVMAVLALKSALQASGVGHFLLLVTAGATVYLAVSYLLDRFLHGGMQSLVTESLASLRGS